MKALIKVPSSLLKIKTQGQNESLKAMTQKLIEAPELEVQKWLNTKEDLSLKKLRGKVIAIYAFQMLCPGCVEHSIPQARNVFASFNPDDLIVIGLHTVFEHHQAMAETALKAFIHEYKIKFPVAIDTPSEKDYDPIPKTMRTYNMAGTPSLILIDRLGFLRKYKMGHEHDLKLGAELMALMKEETPMAKIPEEIKAKGQMCKI